MPSVLLVAGDLSGDNHAAMLARRLSAAHPDFTLTAVGGAALRATGARMLADSSGYGVIGLVPALLLVPRLLGLQRRIARYLRETPPDVAVLCDWGGFNVRLLPLLAQHGVPTLYYFPPASWRRSGERGLALATQVDCIATPFRWSAQRLNDAGGHAEWVGHPLLESAASLPPRHELRRGFGVEDDTKLIALLPGSRRLELQYIAPHLVTVMGALQTDLPAQKFKFVAAAPLGGAAATRSALGAGCQVIEGRSLELLAACDAAVVKSGTSTLEAAVAGAPQVVVYDVPPLLALQSQFMGGRKKTPFVAMPNIILQRSAVAELLGPGCRPAAIVREVKALLFDADRRARLQCDYGEVIKELGAELHMGASERTAQLVASLVRGQ